MQTDAPLLTPEEIVQLIEQADALRQARPHGREVFLRHPGDARSAHLGRGLDFEEVRAYQAGDDIRAMDWRTTARTGKPYLKIYREEHHPALHLVPHREDTDQHDHGDACADGDLDNSRHGRRR